MKNIIIGTAGHVDHGKTTLIKALSGIDTDRLDEEKKRGITIELGFAHIPNDAGYNIGVIDVPGHEKFIKHMLAGIGGIDFVLFVVAADEGIMPQTREHFEILSALGIEDGIIAVTKKDMVDPEWMEMLLEEVKEYFAGSFLDGKPIIPVSSTTGEGVEELRAEIIAKCDRDNKRREEKELFRLPVDRVFTMQGFGTVITGTLMDGQVSTGEDVTIYPGGAKVKIRGIQTYGKDTDTAIAGQRTAINLSGADKADIERGDVLARPGSVVTSSMLDAELRIFDSSERTVLSDSRVHLYTGSSEQICKVVLMDRDSLSAGESGYAQLRLEKPIAIRRGDRFIIRFYSPMVTIGGGRIIDARPVKHKRNRQDVLDAMEIMAHSDVSDIIISKASGNRAVRLDDLAEELGMLKSEISRYADEEAASGRLIIMSDNSLVSTEKYEFMKKDLAEIIRAYHESNPLSDGIPRQELISRLRKAMHTDDDKYLMALMQKLSEDNIIEMNGKSVALAGFKIEYSEEQLAVKSAIARAYEEAGIEMLKEDELPSAGQDIKTVKAILSDLCAEGLIVKLSPEYHIDTNAWNKAIETAEKFETAFTLAEYRDALGTSRKYASELLSAMDRRGITKFSGDSREVIGR